MSGQKSSWEAYAPPGSKRRQVLKFVGVGGASTSWFSRAKKGSDVPDSTVSQRTAKPAYRTTDSTQSLSRFFSPSQRNEVGPASVRARKDMGDINEESSMSTAQWEENSQKLRAEQKEALWIKSAVYDPSSTAPGESHSDEMPDDSADDEDTPQKKKDKIQFVARRNARSAQATMKNVLTRKIFISKERVSMLKQLYEDVKTESLQPSVESILGKVGLGTESAQKPPIQVLMIGFDRDDPHVEEFCESLGQEYLVGLENFVERDWVRMMKTARSTYTVDGMPDKQMSSGVLDEQQAAEVSAPEDTAATETPSEKKKKKTKEEKKKRQPQVVVIRIPGTEVTEFQTCTMAAHFMANRIVCPFLDADDLSEEQRMEMKTILEDLMQSTWAVHNSLDSICKFCKEEAPMLLTLNHRIREEVYGKIQHYGKVNYLWHGAKRVPVAFVPFGVSAVNFLGLSKLVANILRDTGMFQDPETTKAGLAQAALSYGKVFILDNIGDLYQITAAGTVVAGLSEALMSGGLIAAVETLGAADFALLGSASLVTGAVAAVGAALSRPDMVESLANLIATLQTLWLVFPSVRRKPESSPMAEKGTTDLEAMDEEGNHAKLFQMCSISSNTQPDAGTTPTASEAGPSNLQAGMVNAELDDKEMQEALTLMLGEEEAAMVLPALQPQQPGNNQHAKADEPALSPQ